MLREKGFEDSYGTKENLMGYPFGKLIRIDYFRYCTVLYSPSRNSASAQGGGETIPYEASGNALNVDPDAWAREPDRVAGLDRNAPAAAGNIINLNNLNIISTDGQSAQTNGIDVSDLTVQAGDADVSGLPKELAEQIGIDTAPEQSEERPAPAKEDASAQPQIAAAVQNQPKPVEEKIYKIRCFSYR